MSDQSLQQTASNPIDGSSLINVPGVPGPPGPPGGIIDINADATVNQLLTVVGPGAWSIPVPGTHRLTITALASITGDTTPAQLLTVVGPAAWSIPVPGTHRLTLTQFAGAAAPGFVPDPGAAGATAYLAADATWKAIPAGGAGLTSINADITTAQLLTVVGPAAWSIPVPGTQRLTLTALASNAAGYVPNPGGVLEIFLAPDGSWQNHNHITVNNLVISIPNLTQQTLANIVIPVNGTGAYFVSGIVYWTANPTGSRGATLRLNGTVIVAVNGQAVNDGGVGNAFNLSFIVAATAGDTISLTASQSSGGALNSVQSNLTIYRLGTGV